MGLREENPFQALNARPNTWKRIAFLSIQKNRYNMAERTT